MIHIPKGTKDILPSESYRWHYIEQKMREVCALYGYREIRTPVFEHTELFLRGVGDTTDVVQKEMYTFNDKGDRSITLKPEGTAGAMRSFIENALYNEPLPMKMYYLFSPTFRYENPQAGRLREHHQFGIEVMGAPQPTMDAEAISLAWRVLSVIGVTGLEICINSIGCPECRGEYNQKLREYFGQHIGQLCDTCKDRLERNPLRIIDCKEERCAAVVKGAPLLIDSLCGECAAHFEALKRNLDAIGLRYRIDPYIVRGLDYYTRTVFEIIADLPAGRLTVCGGGRYDGLCAQLDGPQTAGIGFGMGMERLIMLIEQCGVTVPVPSVTDLYLATLGEDARLEAVRLAARLREDGVKADCDHVGRSLKAQMKYANKLGCAFVAVIGEDELKARRANVRDMKNAAEQFVPFDGIAAYIKERVG